MRPNPRLDLEGLAQRLAGTPVTRFAPSPTGYLHLGHVVNAIYVWGIARALGVVYFFGSRTTIDYGAALPSSRQFSTTSTGSALSLMRAANRYYGRATRRTSTRRHSTGCGRQPVCTRACVPGTLVVRGADLADSTGRQVRLAQMIGRSVDPEFVHHPLVLGPDGAKLSKSEGDTSIRELRAAGVTAPELIGRAAAAVGLIESARQVHASEVPGLFEA